MDLSEKELNTDDVNVLTEAIQSNTNLTTLNLLYNDLGKADAEAVAQAAEQQGKIKTLCGIRADQTTKTVDLSRRGDDDDRPRLRAPDAVLLSFDFKHNSLTSVNLLRNNLGEDGAASIVAAARKNDNIKTLCGIEEGAIDVDLMGRSYHDETLKAPDAVLLSFDLVHGALKFNTLDLRDNKIGSPNVSGVKALAEALADSTCTLTALDVRNNDLGFDGSTLLANAVFNNTNIETFCGVPVQELRNNELDELSPSEIGACGAMVVARLLPQSSNLRIVRLNSSKIGDQGAVALSEALKTNTSIQTLELNRNNITFAGAQSLADMLKDNHALTTLDLSYNQIGGYRKQVGSSSKTIATPRGPEALFGSLTTANSTLTELNFSSNGLVPGGLNTFVVELPGIMGLTFKKDGYDVVVEAVAAGSAAAVAGVRAEDIIRTVNGKSFSDSDTTMGALQQSARPMQIAFADDLRGAESIAKCIKSNTALRSLNLAENDIRSEGSAISEALQENQSLTKIDLRETHIGVQHITDIVNGNTSLTEMDVRDNGIEDDRDIFRDSLARAVSDNTTIETFCRVPVGRIRRLQERHIDISYVTDLEARVVAELLEKYPNKTGDSDNCYPQKGTEGTNCMRLHISRHHRFNYDLQRRLKKLAAAKGINVS